MVTPSSIRRIGPRTVGRWILLAAAAASTTTFVGPIGHVSAGNPDDIVSTPLRQRATTTAVPTPDRLETTPALDRIACPLDGPSEFVDSWGARRSGGRRHQGVDMAAPHGTPVVAAQDGTVNFKRNRLGGNAVWLTADNGNKFYYAHLDRFEGESRRVERGEVIGFVGSTGNAQGPHLHFETHFGGSAANPYDATFEACVAPIIEAELVERMAAVARERNPFEH